MPNLRHCREQEASAVSRKKETVRGKGEGGGVRSRKPGSASLLDRAVFGSREGKVVAWQMAIARHSSRCGRNQGLSDISRIAAGCAVYHRFSACPPISTLCLTHIPTQSALYPFGGKPGSSPSPLPGRFLLYSRRKRQSAGTDRGHSVREGRVFSTPFPDNLDKPICI